MKRFFKFSGLLALLALTVVLSSYRFQNKDNSLTPEEVKSLLFMLEEEKMAYDVYSLMDEKWGTMQFNHIKDSELMHMDAVKAILDGNNVQYSLLSAGKFKDQNLQKLYNSLIAQGNISEVEALKAGAKIEDVDIYDLIRLKKQTQNAEIIRVYNFLECGSRNHLRAFTRGLNRNNATYTPEFISQKDYDSILNADQEKCGQEFGMGGKQMNGQGHGKGMGQGKSGGKECSMNDTGHYGQKAERGEVKSCGGCSGCR